MVSAGGESGMDHVGDGDAVVQRVKAEGIEAHVVTDYGWPAEIELALVDAVMSIRAKYGTSTSGVLGRVLRYRSSTSRQPLDDLTSFVRQDSNALHQLLGSQKSAGRLKSDICLDVASRLIEAGVSCSGDLQAADPDQKKAWTGTRGLDWITWEYFTMLLGHPGVKADTMITRFVAASLDLPHVDAGRAHAAVSVAASVLQVQPRDLDHAIWRQQSGRPVRR